MGPRVPDIGFRSAGKPPFGSEGQSRASAARGAAGLLPLRVVVQLRGVDGDGPHVLLRRRVPTEEVRHQGNVRDAVLHVGLQLAQGVGRAALEVPQSQLYWAIVQVFHTPEGPFVESKKNRGGGARYERSLAGTFPVPKDTFLRSDLPACLPTYLQTPPGRPVGQHQEPFN